ncbi:MAG: aspartate carbamoyltransferase [Bdellovibrionales bacterium CG12_big_fil_rev_8_21_14_0_65_38_15]|nr:MAG: aspartate carbamoyltransferase [Bdellovibrionales bacterium CG22_combo_CG10-13_8_21_14_all_38_13]PIQ55239.1 MAG: aspartate carbamoyltransferase [Bdellovibrionales bacterium CG12_big_fil_rev_8_21_14_0_65_38_15]PIR30513.1 MAG: aspartate carbamoyltransferase [Bdellovibrionales bacterium CG11_big_fil_rev_8_21_14_0_20_38_13]
MGDMNKFPSVFESIDDLTLEQIRSLLTVSAQNKIRFQDRQFAPYESYRKYVVATSFLEHSTRTKHSFGLAIQKLGCMYVDFNAEKSSLQKGESIEETLLTLWYQGVDICVLRTSVSNQFSEFKNNPPIKLINGGDGINEHPTQALLDLFTLIDQGLELDGKTVTIVGDSKHSRVTHSLVRLLPQFGAKVILCGPKEYLYEDKNVELVTNLDEAIAQSDILYMLRIQKERHNSPEYTKIYESYNQNFGINLAKLKKHNKAIPVLHPGPANIGVEIARDVLKSELFLGYQQVVNSVYTRMAILMAMLENGDKTIGHKPVRL